MSKQEQTPNFPNGFINWQETHFEIVSEMILQKEKVEEDNDTKILYGRGGTPLMMGLAREMTDKFEEKFRQEEWFDLDFYEEVYKFYHEEIKSHI